MDGDDSSTIKDHFNHVNKKPGSSHKQDRISALPDHLLALILSLLPDTKDAIITSALSKHWRHVWTCVAHLTFRLFAFSTEDTDYSLFPPFAEFVDKALASYPRDGKVDKFWIHIDHDYIFELHPSNRIDPWIYFAVSRDVDELILEFDCKWYNLDIWWDNVEDFDCYSLPQILYSHSLKVLKTCFCDVVPEGRVNWKSLKVLEIGYANLTPGTIQTILDGSPVLESLKLFKCIGVDRLDIASERALKRLVVDNIWLSGDQSIYSDYFVLGPSLQNLQISSTGFHKWRLINLSSLHSVQIAFEIFKPSEEDMPGVDHGETCRLTVKEILEKVDQVEELKLGNWCIQVISTMEIKGFSSPSLNCKSLVLQVRSFCEWDLPGIVRLLCSSSKLERIEIDLSSTPENEKFDIHPDCGNCISRLNDYWKSFKLQGAQGLLSNLKTVEIFGFTEERLYEQGLVFEFIAFLLKRTKVLQKMVIRRRGSWGVENVNKNVIEIVDHP